MFCKRLNPVFAAVGVITFALGMWAAYGYKYRNYREPKPEPRFEELEITGFEQVTSAKDGALVTILGDIDIKGVCDSYQIGKSDDICETWSLGSKEHEGMPIRILMCSDNVRANCILPFKDTQHVYALDTEGKLIDFFGFKNVGPNAWMTKGGCKLRIMGHVTRVNGVGRFMKPIARIEAGPRYN